MFRLAVDTKDRVVAFMAAIQSCIDEFSITTLDGRYNVNAKSYLGVLYALTEFPDKVLINQTTPNYYPVCLEEFRKPLDNND